MLIPTFQIPKFQIPNFQILNFQIPNIKFQIFKFRISGTRADIVTSRLLILTFQVNGTGNESCGSETEL